MNEQETNSTRSLGTYVLAVFKSPSTYGIAAVVGTLINLYGHLLVPWLKGESEPWKLFCDQLVDYPSTTALSIAIAYVFPFGVGIYSAVMTRMATRKFESRALFPDTKPDPVFRIAPSGRITEMGATTERLFVEHRIESAADFLGASIWERWKAGHRGQGIRIHCDALGETFIVSSSDGPDGSIHVYAVRANANA